MSESSLKILPATQDERDWAAGLFSSSDPWKRLGISYEDLIAITHDREYLVYIAHIQEKPCAVLIIDPRGLAGAPYIKSVSVEEEYRNRGIGAHLVAFAENLFKQKSPHLFLCVSSFNIKARAFYERLGYSAIAVLKDHIKMGEAEILMYKRIS